MSTDRNERLDRLALGSNCHKCGATADEPCRTPRGKETLPHTTRINRAVGQYKKESAS